MKDLDHKKLIVYYWLNNLALFIFTVDKTCTIVIRTREDIVRGNVPRGPDGKGLARTLVNH